MALPGAVLVRCLVVALLAVALVVVPALGCSAIDHMPANPAQEFPDEAVPFQPEALGNVTLDGGVLELSILSRGIIRHTSRGRQYVPFHLFFSSLQTHLLARGVELCIDPVTEAENADYRAVANRYMIEGGRVKTALQSAKFRKDKHQKDREDFLNSYRKLPIKASLFKITTPGLLSVVRENANLKGECEGLRAENSALLKESAELKATNEELKERLRVLSEEFKAQRDLFTCSWEAREKSYVEKIEALRVQVDALTSDKSDLEKELVHTRAQLSDALAKISELEKGISGVTKLASDRLFTVLELREKQEQLQEDKGKAEKEKEELARLLAEREVLVREKEKVADNLRSTLNATEFGNARLREGFLSLVLKAEKEKEEERKDAWANAAQRLSVPEYRRLVERTLYIKERFNISDEAYHELYMMWQEFNRIPMSHDVKRRKKEIDDKFSQDVRFQLRQTPEGKGWEVNIDAVWEMQIVDALDSKDLVIHEDGTIDTAYLKMAGDGANMFKRFRGLTSLSTTLITTWQSITASKLELVACVSGKEEYDNMSVALKEIAVTVDRIAKAGFIEVDYKGEKLRVPVKIIICSDYKFMLMLLGMKNANSGYPCMWCCAHTNDFQKLNQKSETRTIASILADIAPKNPRRGCKHTPIFLEVPTENYFTDPLHLDLRVYDHLADVTIAEVRFLDGTADTNSKKGPRLLELEAAWSAAAGVKWELEKSAESNKMFVQPWLSGSQKRQVLVTLADHLLPTTFAERQSYPAELSADDRLRQNADRARHERVCFLWGRFGAISNIMRRPYCLGDDERAYLGETAREWCAAWIKAGQGAPGQFGSLGSLTPYMHIMCTHLVGQSRRIGTHAIVSCQAVERLNDILRKDLHRGCRYGDPARSAMLKHKRKQELAASGAGRQPRKYNKKGSTSSGPQTIEDFKLETRPDEILRQAHSAFAEFERQEQQQAVEARQLLEAQATPVPLVLAESTSRDSVRAPAKRKAPAKSATGKKRSRK